MLHEILTLLSQRGHDVCVYCPTAASNNFEGIQIVRTSPKDFDKVVSSGDLLITQLENSKAIMDFATGKIPVAFISHFDTHIEKLKLEPRDDLLIVFNSLSMKQNINWNGHNIVVPPPVVPSRYATSRGESHTIINFNDNKGGQQFWRIAKSMPDLPFLAVHGAYGKTSTVRAKPKNARLMSHTANIRQVYSQTKVLLMPSLVETYGRTAIEAAASGIPTIASPTQGLKEALGDAGIYVDRDDHDGWIEAIRHLQEPNNYSQASSKALSRSQELEPTNSIISLEHALLEIQKK
jgi:glycosyltransferase involved in cell wall biosynthesis